MSSGPIYLPGVCQDLLANLWKGTIDIMLSITPSLPMIQRIYTRLQVANTIADGMAGITKTIRLDSR